MQITFDLPEEHINAIKELQNNGMYTENYIVKEAFMLSKLSRKAQKEGYRFAIVNDNDEIVMDINGLTK